MSGRNEGGLPVPNTAGAAGGGPGSLQQQQQRSGGQGHHHSKSHSGLNSYAAAANATTPNMMDRASSSTGLSPSSGNALSPGGGNSTASNNVAKFRASIDAARSLYANSGNMTPGFTPGASSPSLGPPRTAGGSKRPSSDMLAGSALAGLAGVGLNAENDAIDKWFEDLHHYEATLEEMAAASLDQSFKEELGAIEQWFKVLSEAERTAALYSLLQNSTQVQIRFFITVLQQMARTDPMNALLSPANPQQASMEAQMEAKLASLGLKSPAAASPAVRQFARQSLGAMPGMDLSGFLSPNSAMHQQGNSSPSARHTSLDDALSSPSLNNSTANTDAANLLAQQRARLQANAANRISAPGSLLSAHDHAPLRSPLWSQANNEQVAERSGRSPSPDGRSSNAGRSRPASMISEHSGALSANNNNNNNSNNVSNGSAPARPDINAGFANVPEAQLSPLLTSTNWAAMMQTPLMNSFNGGGEPNSANPDFGNSTQARANWATQSINNSTNANPNFALDDAKKFRRQARASDAGMEGNNQQNVQGILSGMYEQNKRNQQQQQQSQGLNNANQAAAISAQQNWRNVNGLFNGSPNPGQGMPGSPDLNNLASLQAAMASPQIAMANLFAAQQQIQQQMQLQQNLNMLNSMGMSPMGMMNMPNQLQNQQMLSPALGMGMFQQPPHSSASNNSRDRRSPRPDRSVNGDKSKPSAPIIPGTGTNPDEPLDMKLLSDVPAWLRSLRLHKYTPNFEHSNWKEMVGMNDAALDAKGVNALGARRKLLKVFENVRNQQGIPHPPGSEIPDSNTPDPTANDS